MSSISILDDDSLLNVFYLYRLTIFYEDKTANQQIFEGIWVRERWWYKLAHVCQRWRSLILGSPSYLSLCLVCTYHTPVADILAHSPPFPLVIDYFDEYYEEPGDYEDEAGILIALQQLDRVRRIRLGVSTSYLQRLIPAIDGVFPMLEYLCIMPMDDRTTNAWILPISFQAPRLRHLILSDFDMPIRSPLLTTEAGLVTLTLQYTDSLFSYFSPTDLLQQLSLMHHLQSFAIDNLLVPDDDVHEQLLRIERVTLPNLHSFAFRGEGAFLEALLPHIATPLLGKLYICLFDQHALSVPQLLQFIITTENFTGQSSSAVFQFDLWDASVVLYSDVGPQMYSLWLCTLGSIFNDQVTFPAHVLDILAPILSEVVHLTLEYQYREGTIAESTQQHNQPDHTDWRKLLGSFGNVKTLSMHNGLVGEVSRSLRWDDGESPVNLLPELDKLECYGSGNTSDMLAPFIDARRNAGCPVTLVSFEHFPFPRHAILPIILSPFEASQDLLI